MFRITCFIIKRAFQRISHIKCSYTSLCDHFTEFHNKESGLNTPAAYSDRRYLEATISHTSKYETSPALQSTAVTVFLTCFDIQKFCTVVTKCICVFPVLLMVTKCICVFPVLLMVTKCICVFPVLLRTAIISINIIT
jgi:hypothetical protein